MSLLGPAQIRALLRDHGLRPRQTLGQNFLADPDERLVRMAAREIVRRKPADFENMLLQLMTAAPASVRRNHSEVAGRNTATWVSPVPR